MIMSTECKECRQHFLDCTCLINIATDGVHPPRHTCVHAMDGYEVYKLDDYTIGVRPVWISVKDRFPEKGQFVLCVSNKIIFQAWWDRVSSDCGDWYDAQNSWIIEDVTHWMPLPDLPK